MHEEKFDLVWVIFSALPVVCKIAVSSKLRPYGQISHVNLHTHPLF